MTRPSHQPDSPASAPWPQACGLLAAALTTIVGCLAGYEPETILQRCMVCGVIVCCVAMLIRHVWRFVSEPHHD